MTATLTPVEERTWKIDTMVKKYDAADVTIDDRRVKLRGFANRCRRRTRIERHVTIREGATPFEVLTAEHNLLVNAGIQRMLDLLIVAGGQGFNNANSRIGVGDSTTAASASQTDLQAIAGASDRQFEIMDATFPSRASQTVTWRSTFASGEANFHWQEWCIDPGTAAGTTIVTPMLNRKVTDLSTKVAGQVWQFSVTLTIS